MTFGEWKRYGVEHGWLTTPESHVAVDPDTIDGDARPPEAPIYPEGWFDLDEYCAAHSEGLWCCLDHKDVYVVKPVETRSGHEPV